MYIRLIDIGIINGALAGEIAAIHPAIVAFYEADSLDLNAGVWYDKSGSGNHAQVSGSIKKLPWAFGGRGALRGLDTTANIRTSKVLPTSYTMFFIARYSPQAGQASRLFVACESSYNAIFGYYAGMQGWSHPLVWVSDWPGYDRHKRRWLLNTVTFNRYAAQGIERTNGDYSLYYRDISDGFSLCIGTGYTPCTYCSPVDTTDVWEVAAVLIFSDELRWNDQVPDIERWLIIRYSLGTIFDMHHVLHAMCIQRPNVYLYLICTMYGFN